MYAFIYISNFSENYKEMNAFFSIKFTVGDSKFDLFNDSTNFIYWIVLYLL